MCSIFVARMNDENILNAEKFPIYSISMITNLLCASKCHCVPKLLMRYGWIPSVMSSCSQWRYRKPEASPCDQNNLAEAAHSYRPSHLLLMNLMASSMLSTVMIGRTGPKISSCMSGSSLVTSTYTAGAMKQSPSSRDPLRTFLPREESISLHTRLHRHKHSYTVNTSIDVSPTHW